MRELIEKLKPIYPNIEDIYIEHFLSSPEERREIEQLVYFLAQQNFPINQINLIPPKDLEGEYPLGMIIFQGKPYSEFLMQEKEWIQHLAIFGRSGSGKTNIIFKIIENFIQKKKPFLIFDWKRNYRDILQKHDRISIFTPGRDVAPFSFNPLIPPTGTSPIIWLKKIIEIISHAYFLGEGVIYLLTKAIDSCYRNYKVYSSPKYYPTFHDVLLYLENYKTSNYREDNWRASALRAISQLCFGETGRIFLIQEQFPIESILKKNVILELDALSNSDKTFFIESLLLWIHHLRLQEPERETFKHAIIIEEAHHILLRKKQELSGNETITDTILREIRELGESIILIDQHPSLISIPALGNTYTTICLNLKHKDDIEMASRVLLLKDYEKEFLGKLPIGQGIVKLQGRFLTPFLVNFPLYTLKKGFIRDFELKSRAYHLKPMVSPFKQEPDIQDSPSQIGIKLKAQEKEYLVHIHKEPFLSVMERVKALKFSPGNGYRTKERLKEKGLIKEVDIAYQKNKLRLLDLTEKGISLLNEFGFDISRAKRLGSLQHEFWKEKIFQEYMKKGFKVTKEYPIGNGKTVDVVAEKNGKKIAIEIETSPRNKEKNIEKCRGLFDEMISIDV